MIDPLVKFGLRIKKARKWAELSQADVAKAANLEPAHVSHFECGRRKPSMRNLIKLADALGVSTDWLLGRVEHPNETLPPNIFRDLRAVINRVECTFVGNGRQTPKCIHCGELMNLITVDEDKGSD